jgi:hypothetical protein
MRCLLCSKDSASYQRRGAKAISSPALAARRPKVLAHHPGSAIILKLKFKFEKETLGAVRYRKSARTATRVRAERATGFLGSGDIHLDRFEGA